MSSAQKSLVDLRLNDGEGDSVDDAADRVVVMGFDAVLDLIRTYCVLASDASLPA